MFVTMLGVGNGFSDGVYNNNALLECDGQRTLIDCGVTAWESLSRLGLRMESIERIFITHLHFDHAGGLEAAALYSKYFSHKKLQLIVPAPLRKAVWENLLKGGLWNPEGGCTALEDYFDVAAPAEGERFALCGGAQAVWFPTRHIPGKFSCGLLAEGQFAYTSDMQCDLPLAERLLDAGVKVLFHDCQIGPASVHASYDTLLTYPQAVREKLLLMHHGLLVPPSSGPLRFARQHERMDLDAPADEYDDIEENDLIRRTIAYMKKRQKEETTGHDWLHTERVYRMAMRLARESSRQPDLVTVALGALLHDIDDWKFNDGNEDAGPQAAASWLRSCGAPEALIQQIQAIIRDLSFKGMGEIKKMQTAEGEIVQDADRLDAIGAIGIARAFATGAAFGNGLLDPDLPPRDALRREGYANRKVPSTTVNHFYEKLLHLEALMNTPEAKAEAAARHRFMLAYLQRLYQECGMTEGVHQRLLEEYCRS
ncbi:MAG: MBL fold metallo-hydrolase [Oscillibacter sp.]|nr:MBL fold metallo-hydrolase [Oscillibacter sp.]